MTSPPYDQSAFFADDEDTDGDADGYDPADDSAEDAADYALPPPAPAHHAATPTAGVPIFAALLQRAIAEIDPADGVLNDYAAHVVPNLTRLLAHNTAKGGNFAAAKGGNVRYRGDQSNRAHIINGLLPTSRLAHTLREWGILRFTRDFDETTYRLFCASYTLHDWLKMPHLRAQLQATGLDWDSLNPVKDLPIIEAILRPACDELGLTAFLAPLGDDYTHDLIMLAHNTQRRNDTMPIAPPQVRASGKQRTLAAELSRFADYIAYLGKTPRDVVNEPHIHALLQVFSDDTVKPMLTYHAVTDLRGILTNSINNAALAACTIPGERVPLLYAPTGVVYLTRADVMAHHPMPTAAAIATATLDHIRTTCQQRLQQSLTGFQRSGKGMKYAPYYDLLFTPPELIALVPRAATALIKKEGAAGKRYASMTTKLLPGLAVNTLPDTLEVDRLAETCALLVTIAGTAAPTFPAAQWLLDWLRIPAEQRATVEHLNSHRQAGGVPYGWYYAAALHYQQHPGRDANEWDAARVALATDLNAALEPHQATPNTASTDAAWQPVAHYVVAHLLLPAGASDPDLTTRLRDEVLRNNQARKTGRGSSTVCALCASSYPIEEQREAAILFAPMVYSNKQPLHGSKGIRHICAICSTEMMLRQLLMKRGKESGRKFEGRRLRYLFFYPTYFFTPETLRVLQLVQDQLKRVSFVSLRKALLPAHDAPVQQVRMDAATFQHLDDLLLDPTLTAETDRLFRYTDREPATFSFVGIPPLGTKAKDAEAWVNPAFLALVLPFILDVKVVASESMLPILTEANEMDETVAFDGAHAYLRHLIGQPRLNLDEAWQALQTLTAAYLVHIEGNAGSGASGYDYNWNALPALARNLATSPLYVFHYFKKGHRSSNQDTFSSHKAALALDLLPYLDTKGDPLVTHAQELTKYYRQFYRAKGYKSNAILRPLSVATKTLLEADPRLFDSDEALVEAVAASLSKFMERVSNNRAEGRLAPGSTHATRQQAMQDFSHYLVYTVYRATFDGDRAALRGTQLNLLKDACELIYRTSDRQERLDRGVSPAAADDPDDDPDDDLPTVDPDDDDL